MSIVGKRRLPKFRFRWKRQLRWRISNKMIDLNGWINLLNCQLFHLSSSLVSHALTLTIARTHAHAWYSVCWRQYDSQSIFFPKTRIQFENGKKKIGQSIKTFSSSFSFQCPSHLKLRSKSSYPSARISSSSNSSSERINLDREKKPNSLE